MDPCKKCIKPKLRRDDYHCHANIKKYACIKNVKAELKNVSGCNLNISGLPDFTSGTMSPSRGGHKSKPIRN